MGRPVGVLVLTSIMALAAAAADPVTEPPPTPEKLVRDLGSPQFAAREAASKALWRLGEDARSALAAGARSPDAEVARRARDLLDRFDAGIYPDTPPAVLHHLREFRSGLLEKQHAAVAALARLGDPGAATLRGLLTNEASPESRDGLFDTLAWTLRREVPKLVAAGQLDRAERLLALNALGPSDAGLMDYAAFLRMRGRSAVVAVALEQARRTEGPAGTAATRALAFVYRVAGDGPRARTAAAAAAKADSGFQATHDALLEDLGAWDELVGRTEPAANSRDGLTLYRLRRAGRTKEADELVKAQIDADAGETGGVDPATLALLLNDHPAEAVTRLRNHRAAPHVLSDVLAAKLEFQDALGLVTTGPIQDAVAGPDGRGTRLAAGTRRGRLLAQLGERDAAAQVFVKTAEQIKAAGENANTGALVLQLIRAEVRAGRPDLAAEHLGAAFVGGPENHPFAPAVYRDVSFEEVFAADSDVAQFWWTALRAARPDEPGGTTVRTIRALLAGTAGKSALTAALAAAKAPAAAVKGDAAEQKALAIATVLRAADRADEALAVLTAQADDPRPPEPAADETPETEALATRKFGRGSRSWVYGTDEQFRFWVELADLLTARGDHRAAAARLEQGWKRQPDNPILLDLSGRALAKAGDATEGARRVELAHWVALGNARLRGRYLEELVTRGHLADARRERDWARDTVWVSEAYSGNVWNQVARASVALKDFAAAADANRRAVSYVLRTPGVSYVEGAAYLTVPLAVRSANARALLAARKPDESVALAAECLAVTPHNPDLLIGLVPALDAAGRTADADRLFRTAWDSYGRVLREYPKSGWARHAAAWLAAGCRRELDAGLEHAKAALAGEPDRKGYKEAVAELHFRRGDRDKAVVLMTDLVAADRRSFYYKRQLERYKSAPLDAPLPDGDDD